MEGIPMADEVILCSEPESSCSEGTTVLSTTHISYQPRIPSGPVLYLITSGSRWGYNGPIENEFGVRSCGLGDSSCRKNPRQPS